MGRPALACCAVGDTLNSPDSIYRTIVCPASEHHPRYNNGSVVTLDDGSLLLVYQCWYTSGSGDASPSRVEGKLSSDGGRTWGTEFIIKESYEPELYLGGGRRIGSPSLLKLESGQMLLFHDVMNSERDHRNFLSRSSDDGLIWSQSVPIIGRVGYYVINNDRVILLSSGRILAPVADHGGPFDQRGVSFGLYSDDEGRTWTRGSGQVVVNGEVGAQEPGVVELRDGRVLMFIRTSLGRPHKCYSEDGGDTWSSPEPMSVWSPTSPQSIRRIPSTGDLLMAWNNTSGGLRSPLTLAVSSNEGRTWGHMLDIETEQGHTYSYPSILFQNDEAVLTYYDHDATAQAKDAVSKSPQATGWRGLVSLKLAIVPLARIYSA
ncbi:MAG: exo-alpha-sialidase [Dehalococcoidia bacterium]|nr:exo-alpha-sialidase [Dehalococcoidia bacterium]